jgi:GT2 family glycosyltransferase
LRPVDADLVSVVIPNWNGARLIGAALSSLERQSYERIEIVVADGNSVDDSRAVIARVCPKALVLALPRNLGFSGNVNAGIRRTTGATVVLLNNDAECEPEFVARVHTALRGHPEVGSVAAKVLLAASPNRLAGAGDQLHRTGLASQRAYGAADNGAWDHEEYVFGANASAVAYRRDFLQDVGVFDECYVSYLEDVDLSLRGHWRNWQCLYLPSARATHQVSATGGGPLASYYVARNSIRLIFKLFPAAAIQAYWPLMFKAQLDRAASAARAWRGAAARATLRGLAAGVATIPEALAARRQVIAARKVDDAVIMRLLRP